MLFRHRRANERVRVGPRLAAGCRRRGLVLLVSADPLLAQAVRADGVHWPEARLKGVRTCNPRWIETASAHSRAAIARAASMGVDAAILSTVFDSGSASAGKPMGALRFRLVARAAPLPVYALGGVTPHNAARAMAHAAGWAAVDAVMSGWKS